MKEVENQKAYYLDMIKVFFSDKANIILVAILLFAFILRLKYMTINAAVWWDEADYLTIAKNFGLGLPEDAAPWRARVIPAIWGIFYYFGANEWFIRLFETIVSVTGIYLTFLVGKTFYNKWVGLMAAGMLTVYFEHLFWTARISLDIYALLLWTLIALLFWKGYNQNKKSYLIAVGALLGFGVYAYDSIGFMAVFLGFYIILTDRLTFLKKAKFWFIIVTAILMLIPFGAYHYHEFKGYFGESSNFLYEAYPRFGRVANAYYTDTEAVQDWERPADKVSADFFSYFTNLPYLFKWQFFVVFLIGLSMFAKLFLGFDLLIKGKAKKLKKDLYILLWGLTVMFSMGFVAATTGFMFEPRFIFPAMPVLFVIIAMGFMKIYKLLAKYNKQAAILVVLGILIFGGYSQVTFADKLINAKKDSFALQKPAGEWLKSHTSKGDTLFTCSLTVPMMYYSERLVKAYGRNLTADEINIKKLKPKYLIIDMYHWDCNYKYVQSNPQLYKPVKAYFLDKEKKKPVIVIFEVKYPLNFNK